MSQRQDVEIWFETTLAGFIALRAGDGRSAARHWGESLDIAAGNALRRTPFLAVASNNAMVGCLIGSGPSAMDREGGRVDAAWAAVGEMAAREEIPLPARSSAFHLMLASRHAQPFSSFLRVRSLALAALGKGLGDANALVCAGAPEEASVLLRRLDQTQAGLPDFLDLAIQAHLIGPFSREAAVSLLDRQLAHLRSYRADGRLPDTFWRQMEAALDLCAFAPLAASVMDAEPRCRGA